MQKAVLSGAVIGGVVLIAVLAVIATSQIEILALALRILWVI